ncbi:SRPBCC family protein [Arthrobacter sp. OAP107]|uniref:SRPBCC family protein n=1 Tax=Arthrobacter sp. OAP107 TaxID=3156445 RepID=UPI0033919F65
MAGAEHEVLVARDAMTVWSFLLDGANLPRWQADVRSVALSSGSAGSPGARYQVTVDGPHGRPVARDYEITHARPGAEIQFQVVAGPSLLRGGFYLSTETAGTRVRFALEAPARGFWSFLRPARRRQLRAAVGQLARLPAVIEDRTTAD